MNITSIEDWPATYLELRNNILGLNSPRARMDLNKILVGIETLISELSHEEVECRRRHTQTPKHRELIVKINERIEFLEQMTTFGALAT